MGKWKSWQVSHSSIAACHCPVTPVGCHVVLQIDLSTARIYFLVETPGRSMTASSLLDWRSRGLKLSDHTTEAGRLPCNSRMPASSDCFRSRDSSWTKWLSWRQIFIGTVMLWSCESSSWRDSNADICTHLALRNLRRSSGILRQMLLNSWGAPSPETNLSILFLMDSQSVRRQTFRRLGILLDSRSSSPTRRSKLRWACSMSRKGLEPSTSNIIPASSGSGSQTELAVEVPEEVAVLDRCLSDRSRILAMSGMSCVRAGGFRDSESTLIASRWYGCSAPKRCGTGTWKMSAGTRVLEAPHKETLRQVGGVIRAPCAGSRAHLVDVLMKSAKRCRSSGGNLNHVLQNRFASNLWYVLYQNNMPVEKWTQEVYCCRLAELKAQRAECMPSRAESASSFMAGWQHLKSFAIEIRSWPPALFENYEGPGRRRLPLRCI